MSIRRHDARAGLQQLLRKRLDRLQQDTLAREGRIPPEQLAEIEKLAAILKLSEPPPERWPAVVSLLAALALASALFLIRVRETEISLEVECTETGFFFSDQAPVLDRTQLVRIGVSGIGALRVEPDLVPELATASGHSGFPGAARISVGTHSANPGSITTETLIPPRGTHASLRAMDEPGAYRLSLKSAERQAHVAVRAEIRGQVDISIPDVLEKSRSLDFGRSGGRIEFESGSEVMDVDLMLAGRVGESFYDQLQVEGLEFQRIGEFAAGNQSIVTPLSTIRGGTLFLESLDGEKHDLRSGELLSLVGAKGRIESVRLHDDRIAFTFRGSVKGIALGGEGSTRNLMPSLLQWLKARQPLSLIWGTALFAYGLMVGTRRWLRGS